LEIICPEPPDLFIRRLLFVEPLGMAKTALLWKITHPDHQKESYLFGTMHLMENDFRYYLAQLERFIARSEIVLLETRLENEEQLGIPDLQFSDGLHLEVFFRPNQFDKIRSFIAKKYHVDLSQLGHLKPLAILQILQQIEQSGTTFIFPEKIIGDYAGNYDIPVEGLETVEFQFELLKNTPIHEQIRSLKSFVRNSSAHSAHLKNLTEKYKQEDLCALHRMIRKQSGGIRKDFLFERNRNMTNSLLAYLEKHAVFCAVGAGHLWGGKGMLRYLKQGGCKLEPIFLKKESVLATIES
jgi:uncharacterized protein YbaP (TraB family)